MKPWDLFNEIKNIEYTKSGDCVDWAVKVYPDEKIVRLLFDGSSDGRDWINNFSFPAKPYKKQQNTLWFASGWGNAYTSCNDEVMAKLIETYTDALKDDGYKVEICGWSYGGALSVLAAEDFNFRTGNKAGVVTFGAPKPLWGKKTYDYVSGCIDYAFQYAHVNDVITLCVPFPGYRMLNKVSVGSGFCILKLFNTNKYHCIYGEKEIYGAE